MKRGHARIPQDTTPVDQLRISIERDMQNHEIGAEYWLMQVADLALRGYSPHQIAQATGLTAKQVGQDLNVIRQAWRNERRNKASEWMGEELAKLALIEREAWESWEDSKQELIALTPQPGDTGEEQYQLVKKPGDPRYLDMVLKCITDRGKRLGLYAPEKHLWKDGNNDSGGILEIPDGADYATTLAAIETAIRTVSAVETTEDEGRTMELLTSANWSEDSETESL